MSASSADREPIDRLAEEFAERFRRGERPALTEYTQKYPELADEIRGLFPALVVMEQFGSVEEQATSGYEGASAPSLERLGDFRILREVGRGGMGVVYEAVQESLGRHVALKVMPSQTLLDNRQLQRFQREARAAAKLHHTNVVPVFGVGEHDGMHYYVMQFIQGQSLDQVLIELRRLRRLQKSPSHPNDGDDVPKNQAASAVAWSLCAGPAQVPGTSAIHASTAEKPVSGQGAQTSSTIRLPGHSGQETYSETSRQYYQSVARIGVQVADALAYAHGQGVLHRDVKPSNLLLDLQGTVWITDFGLAKAMADQDDLTHTGDIVGTLRYMAPERFQGRGDARSDLYAAGLTLYELITLRPAFMVTDRHQLIDTVLREEPPAPRKLNPAAPRDLETIVLKAIAKDPAHRYATASELAADLRRFLDDKPIQARRVTLRERAWRWCRRNPALASAVAVAILFFCVGFGLVTWKWQDERLARADADHAAEEAQKKGEQIRQDAEKLAAANEAVYRARFHGEQGQWAKAEAEYTRATELRPDSALGWYSRAEFYGELGLWDLARADEAKAAQIQEPAAPLAWLAHAILLVEANDRQGYARLLRQVQQRFPERDDTVAGQEHALARIWTIVPNPRATHDWALRMAERGRTRRYEDPKGYFALGAVYVRAGQPEKAIHWLQEASDSEAGVRTRGAHLPFLALAKYRLGRHEEAQETLREAARTFDGWTESYAQSKPGDTPLPWIDWLEFQLLYREARTLIEGVTPPEDVRGLVRRSRALDAIARHEPASADLRTAAELAPQDVNVQLALFQHHVKRHRWKDAAAALTKATELDGNNRQIPLDAFKAYAEEKRWTEAEQQLAKATALAPSDVRIRLALFNYHGDNGNWEEADAALAKERAKDERERSVGLLMEAARFLGDHNQDERAVTLLTECAGLQPTNASVWNNLGVAYARLHNLEKAFEAYDKAIALRPAALTYANRANNLALQGKYAQSAQDFVTAAKLEPEHFQYYKHACLAWAAAGDAIKYRDACQELFQRFGQSPDPATLSQVADATTIGIGGLDNPMRLVHAIEALRSPSALRRRRTGPADTMLEYALGRACLRAGLAYRAANHLKSSRVGGREQRTPADAFLATACFECGEYKDARQALERAKQVPPAAEANWAARLAQQLATQEAERLLNAPHRREMADAIRNDRWHEAIQHLDVLLEDQPDSLHDRYARARCFIELGDLHRALADMEHAYEVGPRREADQLFHVNFWYSCIVRLSLGDEEGYRRACVRHLERFGNVSDPELCSLVALPFRYFPKSPELNRALELARKSVEGGAQNTDLAHDPHELYLRFATLLYQSGEYAKAYVQVREARRASRQRFWEPYDTTWHALILHQLGDGGLAWQEMEKALAWMERYGDGKTVPPDWGAAPGDIWRLDFALMRRQLESTIKTPTRTAMREAFLARDWRRTLELCDRLLVDNPDFWPDWSVHAACHGELGELDQARVDLEKALALGLKADVNGMMLFDVAWPLATVHLASQDEDAYRRLCVQLMERFGATTDPSIALNLALIAPLRPGAVKNLAQLVACAEQGRDAYPRSYIAVGRLGTVLHRAGRHADAIEQLNAALRLASEPEAKISGVFYYWLALAHHGKGELDHARRYLAQAIAWQENTPKTFDKLPKNESQWSWHNYVEYATLRHEAEELLK